MPVEKTPGRGVTGGHASTAPGALHAGPSASGETRSWRASCAWSERHSGAARPSSASRTAVAGVFVPAVGLASAALTAVVWGSLGPEPRLGARARQRRRGPRHRVPVRARPRHADVRHGGRSGAARGRHALHATRPRSRRLGQVRHARPRQDGDAHGGEAEDRLAGPSGVAMKGSCSASPLRFERGSEHPLAAAVVLGCEGGGGSSPVSHLQGVPSPRQRHRRQSGRDASSCSGPLLLLEENPLSSPFPSECWRQQRVETRRARPSSL